METPNVNGNGKRYYIEKDFISIWEYAEDFRIFRKDLPFLKKAIKLLEKKK